MKYLTKRPVLSARIALAVSMIAVIAVILAVVFMPAIANAKPAEPQNEPRAVTWDACKYDDGSNPPCVWAADAMGDGRGTSFKAVPRRPDCKGPRCVDPRIIHISHERAHFLLGWS